jgi:hypothetical protein
MLETKRRPPRAPEDHRMNLYHDTFRGRLRWYVKICKTGRRVDVAEEYSTDEHSDFHKAWEAERLSEGASTASQLLKHFHTVSDPEARGAIIGQLRELLANMEASPGWTEHWQIS